MRKLLSPALLAVAFMLFSVTSARADAVCAGPWLQVEAGKEWGMESSCRCQLNGSYVRGGVLASSFGWGYLWSEGRGVVRIVLQAKHKGDSFDGTRVLYMNRASGQRFEAANGNGITEAMYFPKMGGTLTWTMFYRSECIVQG